MGRKRTFQVNTIKHPSGAFSYEAYGRVGNAKEPDRKRFDTWEEANAYKDVLEARHKNALTGRKAVFTSLSDDEVADAEVALQELKIRIPDKSLSWAIHSFLEGYQGELNETTIEEASRKFLAEKAAENRPRQFDDHKRIQVSLVRRFGSNPTHTISSDDIQLILKERKIKQPKTFNNIIGNLSVFFNWAAHRKQRYLDESKNPMLNFERKKIEEQKREILSSKDAAELMAFAETWREGVLINYFAFALFAGIRPDSTGELAKLGDRQQTKSLINLDTNTIEITGDISKTKEYRTIHIQGALLSFLDKYPLAPYPILPKIPAQSNTTSRYKYLAYLVKKFREACPVKIPHDALRHSFCSYHISISKSIAETALQSGNSESIIRKHYLRRVSDTESKAFWNIRPKEEAAT